MGVSDIRILRTGVESLLQKCSTYKTQDFDRWARLSFTLYARQKFADSAVTDSLVLEQSSDHSRATHDNTYNLGTLTFRAKYEKDCVKRDGLMCSRSDVKTVGTNLRNILSKLETPPSDVESRVRWEEEVWHDVPVAISNMDYFGKITDAFGEPLCPEGLLVYRTGERQSEELLRRLTK